jgi:hypothetical protein
MPTDLDCHLRYVSDGLDGLVDLSQLPAFVRQHLLAGSHGDIALQCSGPSVVDSPSPAGTAVSALALHNQLLWTNGNPSGGPVSTISALFAHSYQGLPGALGIMFDRGFVTSDDPNGAPIYVQQPRQGCAVFLGTIAALRGARSAEEALFTTVHELGHVFNLQHDEIHPNFMHSSAPQPFGPDYYLFTPDEQSQLETCSTNEGVRPGGFPFGSGAAQNVVTPTAPALGALRLSVSLAKSEAWRFEPLQLELSVSLADGVAGRVDAPEIFDPSQDGFRVMIATPQGERLAYRSPIKVCGGAGRVEITRERPYLRDLPLFGQAGGYTFDGPGRHQIWVELVTPDTTLSSNVVDVDIRREVNLTDAQSALRSVLRDPRVSSLLFHREDLPDGRGVHKLARYLTRGSHGSGMGELHYALARAMLRRPMAVAGLPDPRSTARILLESALKDEEASPYQMARREALLRRLPYQAAARAPPVSR